ncbi:lipopolysaccharide biosynthesis protein [Shewanella algae]|uniref:lipopolysaccharide biosynthesis protein n=1 Tax=Shewanella algae TaxID=38313 RepID=UPI003005FF5A
MTPKGFGVSCLLCKMTRSVFIYASNFRLLNMYNKVISVLTSSIISQALVSLCTLLLIKHLSVLEFADYSFFIGLSAVVSGFISNIANRYVIFNEDELFVTLKDAFLIFFVVAIIAFILFFDANELFLISVFLIIFLVSFELKKTILQRKRNYSSYNKFNITKSSIYFICLLGCLVLFDEVSVPIVFILMILSILLSHMIFPKSKLSREREVGLINVIKNVYVNNKFLFIYFIIIPLMSQISIWFLRFEVGLEEQGYFSIAFYIYSVVMILVASMKKVFIAELAHDDNIAHSISKVTAKISIVAAIICCVVYLLFPVFGVIVQKDLKASQDVLGVLLLSSIVSIYFSPYSEVLQKRGCYLFLCKAAFSSLIVMILIMWLIAINNVGSALSLSMVYLVGYLILNYSIYRKSKYV